MTNKDFKLGKNLQDVRKKLGHSLDDVVSRLDSDIKPRTLGGYERGESYPNYEFIIDFAKKFNVNFDWLLTNNGKMFNESIKDLICDDSTNTAVCVEYLPDVYLSAGYGLQNHNEKTQETMILDACLFISDRGVRTNPKSCQIVKVSGNSMSPEYKHGDKIIIDKSVKTLSDGHIFAIRYQGECFIKEVNLLGKEIKLIPLNKEYDPLYIKKDEDFEVIGRVIPRIRL